MSEVTLHLGDCIEYMKGMAAGSVDAIITDPPYGIDKAEWDSDVFPMLTLAANECARLLKDDGICFWFSSIRLLPETLKATSSIPYRWQFIWYASNNMQHGDLGYVKYTPCLVMAKGKAWRDMQDLRDVPVPSAALTALDHPTAKPLRLMNYLVEKGTNYGDTVLDCFMGSGSTGVACVNAGRNFIGCEINPAYFAIAERRIREAQLQPSLLLPERVKAEQVTLL